MNTDGSDERRWLTDCRCPTASWWTPQAGHIYWTNMGVLSVNDGSIERADLDGEEPQVIVPEGATFTPKQIHLDKENGKLYWCDREGMRVMRGNLDGSKMETLVETGGGDPDRGRCDQMVRWHHHRSQAAANLLDAKRPRQRRTGPHLPREYRNSEGRERANRSDIEVLYRRLAGADRSRTRS